MLELLEGEVAIELPTGNFLVTESGISNPTGVDYVRIVDPQGTELVYWHYNEWAEEPQVVMGAIIAAMMMGADVLEAL